jgi:flagellin
MSQTIQGVTNPGSGTTKNVTFNALGLTLTLNDNFLSTTSIAAGSADIHGSDAKAADFQVGAKNVAAEDRIGVSLTSLKATSLNAGLTTGKMATAALAQGFLDTIDAAISTLNTKRGDVGAAQNRLGYASANLATTMENVSAADSVIRDVDMAAEMTTFTKNQILLQAGTAMLAQANQAPQMVLSLFK